MARLEWIKDEEVRGLNHNMVKAIKRQSVDRLRQTLLARDLGMFERGWKTGVDTACVAFISILHDDFGFENTQIQDLLEATAERMAGTEMEGIDSKTMKETLVSEGLTALNNLLLSYEDDEGGES